MSPRKAMIACVMSGATIGIGCTSIVSHHVALDSAGNHYDAKQLRGVPVTIKVPYQLQVTIVDQNFVSTTSKTAEVICDAKGEAICARNIKFTVIDKEEVVTVDQVRPLAGKLDTLGKAGDKDGGNIIEKQYFKRLGGTIEDTTIEEIDKAIGRVFDASTGKKAVAAAESRATKKLDNDINILENVVAIQVFDVHSPCLEQQVKLFLDTHQCNQFNCNLERPVLKKTGIHIQKPPPDKASKTATPPTKVDTPPAKTDMPPTVQGSGE